MVPADQKWFTHLLVVSAMIEALEKLKLSTPKVTPEEKALLAEGRQKLEAET